MNIDQLKQIFKRYHFQPNPTYGQNFLIDDIILQDIVDAAEISSDDKVLEIGPGIGNLTELLCRRAGFVLSVEKDPKFLPVLKAIKKNHRDNFRYEFADALEFDFQKAIEQREVRSGKGVSGEKTESLSSSPLSSYRYKVVANIPYYITGKIIQMFMTAKNKPTSITVLTQKEVAQNVVAKAGSLSVLAISVQLYGEPKIIQIVPARSFYPSPKVDSAVLQIKLFEKPKFKIENEKEFFRVVKGCFAGKRKQIHNTLKNNLRLAPEQVEKILAEAKINPAARPQELEIGKWVELVSVIASVIP